MCFIIAFILFCYMINTFRFYHIDSRFQQNDPKKFKDFPHLFFAKLENFNDTFLMDY